MFTGAGLLDNVDMNMMKTIVMAVVVALIIFVLLHWVWMLVLSQTGVTAWWQKKVGFGNYPFNMYSPKFAGTAFPGQQLSGDQIAFGNTAATGANDNLSAYMMHGGPENQVNADEVMFVQRLKEQGLLAGQPNKQNFSPSFKDGNQFLGASPKGEITKLDENSLVRSLHGDA